MTSPQPATATDNPTSCPACGTPSRGRFCTQCGADLAPTSCPGCRQTSPPGSLFCVHCGASLTRRTEAVARLGLARFAPWVLGGALGIALIGLVFRGGSTTREAGPAGPRPSPAQGLEAPPDLSKLSPRERFDQLYQRIISAAQQGDQATVERFTPMAFGAYQMLDSITVDARYHLAMLQLHVGDLAGAQAQADTIRRRQPNHLFGYVIGAAVARWNKKDAIRDAMYREFSSRYETEIATGKPEYLEHQAMLVEVRKTAARP